MKTSLRTTFAALWLLIVVICAALAFWMVAIYRLGVGSQVGSVQEAVETASARVGERFTFFRASFPATAGSWSEPQRQRELELIRGLRRRRSSDRTQAQVAGFDRRFERVVCLLEEGASERTS